MASPGDALAGPEWQIRTALCRTVVYDRIAFFYAFGNTPPAYLFPDVDPAAPVADVLSLGCGDPRSVLYSVWREYTYNATSAQRARFLLNDRDVYVLARDVVLFELLRDPQVSDEDVVAVWFSLGLNRSQSELLGRALLDLSVSASPAEVGIEMSACDWDSLGFIFKKWSKFNIAKASCDKMRRAWIEKHFAKLGAGQSLEELAKMSGAFMSMQAFHRLGLPLESITRACEAYILSGDLQAKGVADRSFDFVNPTLFTSESQFNLHYGSNPFTAFPLFSGTTPSAPTPKQDLLQYCVAQLAAWRRTLVKRLARDLVEISMALGDGVELCMREASESCGKRFDVIYTSNVADHTGLLPVLLACRGVVRSTGVLTTSTLLHLGYSADVDAYLLQHLFLPSEFWPSVLGWRCLGHEGSQLAPVTSEFSLQGPDLGALIMRQQSDKDEGSVRSEAVLVWRPAPFPSSPLAYAGPVQALVEELRAETEESFLDGVVQSKRDHLRVTSGMSALHMGTVMPVLLRTQPEGLAAHLQAPGLEGEVEGMMGMALGRASPEELVVCEVPYAAWAVSDVEPQPLLRVQCVRAGEATDKKSSIVGVWTLVACPGGPVDRVRWVMKRATFDLVDAVMLLGKASMVGPPVPKQNVRTFAVAENALERWGRSLSGSLAAGAVFHEEPDCVRAEISDTPEAWWAEGAALDALEAGRVMGASTVEVGIKGKAKKPKAKRAAPPALEHAVSLQFSTPVDVNSLRIQVSRARRVIIVVAKRAPFGVASRCVRDTWLQDFEGTPPATANPQLMVTYSGLQMSESEKILARSSSGDAVPPLVSVKDSIMFFFQAPEQKYWTLSRAGDGGWALVTHHGNREDPLSGVPCADVSICFLERFMIDEFLQEWLKLTREQRHIMVEPLEEALLRQFVATFRGRVKDTSWHRPGAKAWEKKYFTRLLIPPLLCHQRVTAKQLTRSVRQLAPKGEGRRKGALSEAEVSQLKDEGVALVGKGKFGEALVKFKEVRTVGADVVQQMPLVGQAMVGMCCANGALCALKLAEKASGKKRTDSAGEAISLAVDAVRILGNIKEPPAILENNKCAALIAKATYRAALAYEMLGEVQEAWTMLSSIESIHAPMMQDAAVQACMERLRKAK